MHNKGGKLHFAQQRLHKTVYQPLNKICWSSTYCILKCFLSTFNSHHSIHAIIAPEYMEAESYCITVANEAELLKQVTDAQHISHVCIVSYDRDLFIRSYSSSAPHGITFCKFGRSNLLIYPDADRVIHQWLQESLDLSSGSAECSFLESLCKEDWLYIRILLDHLLGKLICSILFSFTVYVYVYI